MRSLRTACILTISTLIVGGCEGAGGGEGVTLDLFGPSPGEVAREAFNVYDPDRRRRAVNTLAKAPWGGEAPYLRTYRLLVDDPDPTVRAACLRALGRHGHPSDVESITPYLRDETSFVRWEAAMALERLHHPDAVDPLIDVLRDDEDADVRLAAARALGQYAEERVFEALVGALNDRQYSVVRQTLRSLELLTGEQLGDRSSEWLAWYEENRDAVFVDQQPYYYEEFIRPPGLLDHVQFWRQHPTAEPQQPLGLEGTQRVEVAERPSEEEADEQPLPDSPPPAEAEPSAEESAPSPEPQQPQQPEPTDEADTAADDAADDEEDAEDSSRRNRDHPLGASDSD